MTRSHRQWCIAVASVAVLLFAWAISLLAFRWPHMSWPALRTNAAVLIYIWALGPAVWFALEWKLWRDEPGLEIVQRHARDFWIGAGAIVLLLAAKA
ncbi:MAG TPA: hypothetical protein VHB47_08505 [Thermoanaerobaculia bacterium]|jgi:hypothetical protein|nr:hypothetical protein [Thermoanaerobaculia bacterium]